MALNALLHARVLPVIWHRPLSSVPGRQKQRQSRTWVAETPYLDKEVEMIDEHVNRKHILARMKRGMPVCIKHGEDFRGVLKLYQKFKNRLGERDAISSFEEYQTYAATVQKVLKNFLVPLSVDSDGEIAVAIDKLPPPTVSSDWLKKTKSPSYIEIRELFGLQQATKWFRQGIKYTELPFKIYPLPGCYFANPQSSWICAHYKAFNTWLAGGALSGMRLVVDVGAGCGVLSFMMQQYGDNGLQVLSLDKNPDAVQTIKYNLELLSYQSPGFVNITAKESDLLAGCDGFGSGEKPDLIVFNPPWLPTSQVDAGGNLDSTNKTLIGLASYRPADLMERFLNESYEKLKQGGKVCVIYSNYAALVGLESGPNPMELELTNSERFKLVTKMDDPVPIPRSVRNNFEKPWKSQVIKSLKTQLWIMEKL